MPYEELPEPQTTYNTEISGEKSTNFIGGVHSHHQRPPIARPIVTQKASQTFVSRVKELKDLHELLQGDSRVAIVAAISGLGGVGKTELAVQYAISHDQDYPAGVWWLSGRDVMGQVLSYGVRMGMPMTGTNSTPEQKVQECYDFWRQGLAGRRLVIVDDVTTVADYEAIVSYLPTDPSFRILMTTRERLQVRRLDLGVLSEGEAIEFLTKLLGSERVAAEGSLVKELCKWLGYLPLGLELVGRYLVSKPRTSVATLLERLAVGKLEARSLLRGQPMTSTHGSLAAAFEVSWVTLEEQTEELAAFLSLFGLAAIPQDLLASCFEWEAEDLEDAWDRLMNLHLVGKDECLHPIVREFLTVKLDQRLDCGKMRERYTRAIVTSAENHCEQTMTLDQLQAAKVYETHWLDFNKRQSEENFGIAIATVCMRLDQYYSSQGLFGLSREPSERALAIREKQLGPDHPDTGTSLNNLAGLYRSMGHYNEAEPLYQRALAISEKQLGPDHPDTGTSLNNLAGLCRSMGHYNEAEPLYQRALAISEKQLGPDHPDTGTSLNNLALLYRSMGRYNEAEPLYQRALVIREKQLGPDHPSTGISLNNLALLYESMGRYNEAEPLYQRALAISEKQLGPDHPDTGTSLNNLALLYESMGRYNEAEPLYQRALAISEKQLGPDHPFTGTSLNNLAGLYRSMRRYNGAEPLYQRALAISEKQLGPDHPSTGTSLNNLGLLYESMGRYNEAEPLYQRALAIREKQLGPDHPSTGTSLNNLAGLYESMGRYSEAEPLYQRALAISEKQLGPDHPDTGTSLNNLAGLYYHTDRLPEAAAMMSRVISIFEKVLGNDHPNTKTIRENLQMIRH
jgi:tetratricopeptide (TPR) repeat protein